MAAEPTESWAVDLVSAADGSPLARPVRQAVFGSAEIAREHVSQRRAFPRDAYRVARLWQERRADGTRCTAYVPGDPA